MGILGYLGEVYTKWYVGLHTTVRGRAYRRAVCVFEHTLHYNQIFAGTSSEFGHIGFARCSIV